MASSSTLNSAATTTAPASKLSRMLLRRTALASWTSRWRYASTHDLSSPVASLTKTITGCQASKEEGPQRPLPLPPTTIARDPRVASARPCHRFRGRHHPASCSSQERARVRKDPRCLRQGHYQRRPREGLDRIQGLLCVRRVKVYNDQIPKMLEYKFNTKYSQVHTPVKRNNLRAQSRTDYN